MEGHRGSRPAAGGQHSTWIAFAGVMMLILGSLDLLWGLAAVLNDEVVVVGGHGVIVFDITTWGWIQLVVGAAVVLTGLGLLVGHGAARWAGIFLLAFNAVLQIVWFPAAPLWALLMITLDLVLIYQLCINWVEE
jgi:hypothetical protein